MPSTLRLAMWATALFIFVVPWERSVAVPGLGGAGTPVGAVAFLLVLASCFESGRVRLRAPSLVLVLMALFVIWSAFTYFWSITPSATLGRTISYAQLFVMVWLIWQIGRDRGTVMLFLQAYVLGSLFTSLVVVANFVSGRATVISSTTGLTRFSFGGGDPNYLALTVALAIPMAWLLIMQGRLRTMTLINLTYIPLAIVVIGLTGSRGGAVSVIMALLVIPATYRNLRFSRQILVLAGLTLMGYVGLDLIPEVTIQRLIDTPQEIASNDLTGRVQIWQAGLEYLSEQQVKLVTGAGSGTYSVAVEPFLRKRVTGHNAYLNILVENGVIGLGLFLAILGAALVPNLGSGNGGRSFAFFTMLALAVGIFALSWEREKPLWIVIALLTSYRAFVLDTSAKSRGESESIVHLARRTKS